MVHADWAYRSIARLSIIGNCQGQAVVCVHHFEATTAKEASLTDDPAAVAWANSIASTWNTSCKTAYLAAHTNDFTLTNIQSQVIERPSSYNRRLTATDLTPTGGVVGTIGATADDMTTAVVIKWTTAIAGKSHRGRSYIGPLSDTQSNVGLLVPAQVTLYTGYVTAVLGQWGPTGAQAVDTRLTIYSKPYNYQEYGYVRGQGTARTWYWPPDYDGNSTNVLAGAVDSTLRTQRRRQIGVGS